MKNQPKIKIIFLLPSLVPGGAERVISFVCQNIDKEKFEPILLIAGFEKDSVYDVSNIKVIYLNKSRILTAMPQIFSLIMKYRPDIVLSSISHVNTAMSVIAPVFKSTKFIGREATILSKRKNEIKKKRWSLIHFLPNGFKNLDMLICQSQDMAEDMIHNYKFSRHKISVINNPISNLPPVKNDKSESAIRSFITVARLTQVKGHQRLLEVLSQLKFPFKYTLIGDGDLKEEILEKAEELGLTDYIVHIPFTNEVDKYIKQHDLFLQGSYVEGFPNAVLESCVMGTPVIAFNVPGGTKEIIEDGVNGFLVNSEEEFLFRLNNTKKWNPKTVRESVYKKFNKEKILSQYEELFSSILK